MMTIHSTYILHSTYIIHRSTLYYTLYHNICYNGLSFLHSFRLTRPEYHPWCSQWPQRRLLLLALFSKHPDIKALLGLSLCPKLGCFFGGYLSISCEFYGGESGELWFFQWESTGFWMIWGILCWDRGKIWSWTLGIWLKEGSGTSCFCDFRGFTFQYVAICGQLTGENYD